MGKSCARKGTQPGGDRAGGNRRPHAAQGWGAPARTSPRPSVRPSVEPGVSAGAAVRWRAHGCPSREPALPAPASGVGPGAKREDVRAVPARGARECR